MLLARPFVRYLAHELVRRIGGASCEFKDPAAVEEMFDRIILDALALEEEINTEARALLNQYTDYMRTNRIPYQEMFFKVKRKILEERKVISAVSRDSGDRRAKISREKVVELSHKLAQMMPRAPGVRIIKRWNEVRLEIAQELTNLLVMEEQVDQRARQMIERQKRDIPEGSEEWNILHRRYYEQEMQRLGVSLSAHASEA